MKAEPKFVTAVLYSHWASALINGDYSGLEDHEELELQCWLENQSADHEGMFYCVGKADDDQFDKPDCGGLPGTVATYTFQTH